TRKSHAEFANETNLAGAKLKMNLNRVKTYCKRFQNLTDVENFYQVERANIIKLKCDLLMESYQRQLKAETESKDASTKY
uniref:Uncharacterized protein n=1 Tax=Xiphophorus maculatus TaxID=8083 RepID=A0A3B5QWT8_XIPMA